MKRLISFLVSVGLVSTVFTPLLGVASADSTPRIYFSPAAATVNDHGSVSIAVLLNANGSSVNAVDINVSFSDAQLSFNGLDKSGSFFNTFLPATPNATNGKLNFSATNLGSGPTSDDVLIGTLNFNAKATSGTANLSLAGSQAANDGNPIAVTTSDAQVALSGATAGDGGAAVVDIRDVAVSAITLNSGVVHWKTAAPSTSSVDYGTDSNYGVMAGSSDLTTEHSVDLKSTFAGHTTVHFRVTSVDSTGNRQSSHDQTFTTLGYAVQIHVINKQHQPQTGVRVSLASGKSAKTDTSGTVTFYNVAAGSQKVTINGKVQSVTIKATKDATAASTPQNFTLVTENSPALLFYGIGLIVVIIGVAAGSWYCKHRTSPISNL